MQFNEKFSFYVMFRVRSVMNHSPFSILFSCSAVLLLCSALLLLFCSVLCSSLLCVLSGREMPFSGREMPFSGREKTMGMGIGPVDTQQGWFCSVRWSSFIGAQVAAVVFSHPLMCRCIRLDWHSFYPHLYAGLYKKLTMSGQLGENIFRSVQSIP